MTEDRKAEKISVEVVLAMPEHQELFELNVDAGSTVADVIAQSGLSEKFENFEIDLQKVGIFGKRTDPDQLVREGDRIEIYRSLIADPKEARRQRALKQA